ncbi:salicylate synthase [Saccharothrix luteola]|uniref:salicylate synthase n=1 Tax=Saccharothrix luteola TaxID=2893018 RepID=UPI001E4AEBAA|nr:salicylate synthase [Saccharothrix luteola]MCC8243056.1 salicylate synthase [Saccharothrix luteola]
MATSEVPGGSARAVRERVTSPEELRRAVPGSAAAAVTSLQGRSAVRRILNRADDRLLVVVGPCSLNDRDSTLEYAERLKGVAEDLSDDVFVVMRAYVEKPRTSFGWPGLAHAPDLLGPPDPERGIRLARSILADITGLGLPVAVEWLTVFGPAYFEDLVSWGCIGARTVEDPTHRSMAGALAMPIGMKNRTDGAIDVAVSAIRVAEREQALLTLAPDGSAAVTRTAGNPDCHLVLRGGSSGPNHHPSAVRGALRLLHAAGLPGRLLVDASHDNCAKDHELQRAVAEGIGRQVGAGNTAIRGVMLESFLLAGRQDVAAGVPLVRGRSVTDACMGWPATVEVLTELARAARARRSRRIRPRAGLTVPAGVAGTPASAAVALVRTGIFDSYVVYERAGTWTVAGGSQATVTLDADRIRVRHGGDESSRPWRSRPLACLGETLAELPIPDWTVYGWLTFEVAHLINGRRDLAGPGDLGHLVVPRAEVRFDSSGTTVVHADARLRDRIRAVLVGAAPESPPRPRTVDLDHTGEWYRQAVASAVREIDRGSFRKVVLSRSVPVDVEVDLLRTYLRGRADNTPARSFLLDLGGRRALGFCPETILEADRDGTVSTQPLAGTRPFGRGREEDRRLCAELLDDPKEVYEHIVSAKVAYDELRRVCTPGTVTVTDLMTVKPRGTVQHLGSRVRGELGADRSSWDALEAVFPAVTGSGIPKAAACEYISRTEPEPRGLYAGAVLTATQDGGLDAGLVLRSLFEEGGRRWLRAGAGIVSSSDPEREYEETCQKLRSIASALSG